MKRTLYIIVPLLILVLMEGISWKTFRSSKEEIPVSYPAVDQTEPRPQEEPKQEESKEAAPASETGDLSSGTDKADSEDFPPPSIEIKNGKTERTIHMGVRQYAWDPSVITVKRGELVRLIIHNADVQHGLAIPELGVNQDIPPDGAVIEFTASEAGTFEFFCSVWCGEGHMEMRGRLVVEL